MHTNLNPLKPIVTVIALALMLVGCNQDAAPQSVSVAEEKPAKTASPAEPSEAQTKESAQDAVLMIQGQPVVYVATDDGFEARPIALNGRTRITGGIHTARTHLLRIDPIAKAPDASGNDARTFARTLPPRLPH